MQKYKNINGELSPKKNMQRKFLDNLKQYNNILIFYEVIFHEFSQLEAKGEVAMHPPNSIGTAVSASRRVSPHLRSWAKALE